ncbi:MAG: patatin-like phospholipase family protein [Rickettsiaceae bacterium]|nr:patatin-like phospholipase family protein [Rickettsiaceae bacterium]
MKTFRIKEPALINFNPEAPAAGGLLDVIPSKIVERMLKHGFTADAVACLFNIIGDVLISGSVKVYGYGLCLVPDLAQAQQLEENKVYLAIKDDIIKYKVVGVNDKIIESHIDGTEITIPTKETLEKSTSAILDVVLKRGHIQARGVLQTALSGLADRFFSEAANSEVLLQNARELDENIRVTNDSVWMNLGPTVASTWAGIPKKYLEYLTKTSSPFVDKLEQMRSIAMVNLAIINIGAGKEDNLLVARQQVKEIRSLARKNMYKNRDSHIVVDEELEIRLGVLEDFFNALGIDNYEEEPAEPNLPLELKRVNYRDAIYICEQHILLSDSLDALLILNQLSKGLVFIGRETFLDRLRDQASEFTEASELIEMLEPQSQITVQIFALKYLKLISIVTGLEFIVCQQNIVKNTYEFSQQIVAVDKPIARIYLAVENQSNIKPVMMFIAIDDKKLENLKEIIEESKNLEDIIDARRGLATHYCNLANDTEHVSHIAGLSCWKQAGSEFDSILNEKPYDINASLGYAECQLRLGKYQKAFEFLKARRIHLQNDPKYALLLAEIFRKKGVYKAAGTYAHKKPEGVMSEDVLTRRKKEVKIINNLLSVTREEFCEKLDMDRTYSASSFLESSQLSEKKALYIEESVFNARKAEKNIYNILSIDGGGIRGIMPALWLSELERRTHRPIAHLFNLITGTSTGGVIGAGLSVPGDIAYAPKYRAFDLLDLYTTRGGDIFTPNTQQSIFSYLPFIGQALGNEKYDNSGRLKLFNSYFEEARLRDSLTELLIPTFDENNRGTKFLFTRREASVDPFKNYKISDVLMATSAAPTYFPAYKFKSSSFLDGAIVANNPSELAFKEATNKHKVDSRDMMLLSLGTGDCVSDPLNAGTSRKGLFWALNLHKAFLDPQHGDADDTLHCSLGDRYYRWQSWMENSIAMDDYSEVTVNRLVDLARECVEEMDASDKNPINQVVERLGGPVVRGFKL